MIESGVPRSYAPVVTGMLLEGINADREYGVSLSEVPFITVIAASFLDRSRKVGLNLVDLRTSVRTRIFATETLLQKLASFSSGFDESLSLIQDFKAWAELCCDAVSFGHMMSYLEVQLVLGIRLWFHESAALQLFAYMCECVRLRGRSLPAALERLFDDPRVSPFLWLDGRPKTVRECDRGIKCWSDPGVLWKGAGALTPYAVSHIYKARNKPTLTQQILESKGRVTHQMVRQLKKRTLEEYLEWELGLPDPLHLEASLASAASSLAKGDLTSSVGEYWSYLRFTVLSNPKLEEQLLDLWELDGGRA